MPKKFALKGSMLWVVSALAGLLFVVLLNVSPLYSLGLSIELPVGWQLSDAQIDCTFQEALDAPTEDCGPATCKGGVQHIKGLPFAMRRENQSSYCGADSNNLALALNTITGLGIGLLYSFVASRRFHAPSK